MPKTSTKRKAMIKGVSKVNGKDTHFEVSDFEVSELSVKVMSKKEDLLKSILKSINEQYDKQWADMPDAEATAAQIKSWDEVNECMSLTNKITLVLTLVNVAIIVYLTIKNI
jgi:hypothetical protein